MSESYVHNCPKSLCMISKLEFVFRNVPSGLRNSVSLLSSQYPRRPEVLPAMNNLSFHSQYWILASIIQPVHSRGWVCDAVLFMWNVTVTERVAIGQFRGPSFSYFFIQNHPRESFIFSKFFCLNLIKPKQQMGSFCFRRASFLCEAALSNQQCFPEPI